MSDMVEKVVEALLPYLREDAPRVEAARAAIEAMRGMQAPTDAMIEAGARALAEDNYNGSSGFDEASPAEYADKHWRYFDTDAALCWTAMIDAALNPPS